MRHTILMRIVILIFIPLLIAACWFPPIIPPLIPKHLPNLEMIKKASAQKQAQEISQNRDQAAPILRLLAQVPDTSEYRKWISYGNVKDWYKSWGIEPIEVPQNSERFLEDFPFQHVTNLSRQLSVPSAFGYSDRLDWYLQEFGFSWLAVDRFIEAGQLPHPLTIAEHSFDINRILEATSKLNYTQETLEPGDILLKYLDEGELHIDTDEFNTMTGRMGYLNEIIINDDQFLVGKNDNVIQDSLDARSGKVANLAENSQILSILEAITDPELAFTGDLTSTVMIDDPELQSAESYVKFVPDQSYADNPLPAFDLAAFSTRHKGFVSYLLLSLTYSNPQDAQQAEIVLGNRLKEYVLMTSDREIADYWWVEKSLVHQSGTISTVTFVMHVDDPEITDDWKTSLVFSWLPMINLQETAFLITKP